MQCYVRTCVRHRPGREADPVADAHGMLTVWPLIEWEDSA